ncbi:MAG TPA: protein kinase [Vicinamibacteria bacterium]|nr:protein kinase [Vicinamibacteria bacterium]
MSARYRLTELLGSGGMGEVHLAEDTQLKRQVALKFLHPAHEADARSRERLQREAEAAAALDHPFICKVYEVGEWDGRLFIAMEHVPGDTLAARLKQGPFGWRDAVRLGIEMAEALDKAHERGIVHRDFKPSNVLMTEHEHVKVMDFGLARQTEPLASAEKTRSELTKSGVLVGTPAYMSPEQLRGEAATPASDLFSLGIVLFEMLTGRHPFDASMGAALGREPAALSDTDGPASLISLVSRLLSKDPMTRPGSAGEVREALREIVERPGELAGRGPSLVGRSEEMTILRRALNDGGLVLIGGEPGVGKTRLAEELLAEAKHSGAWTFTGRSYETEGAPPYVPFVEIFEEMLRDLPEKALRELWKDAAPEIARLVPEVRKRFSDIGLTLELPPEQARRYLFNCILDVLENASRGRAVVLLLDDLHWADEGSLLLLQHIAPRLRPTGVLIVGTYRDVDLVVGRPFARALEALIRGHEAERILLRRLSEASVAEMLETLSQRRLSDKLTKLVYRDTEGNPFFVAEIHRYLTDSGKTEVSNVEEWEVPEGVRLVIGRRLEKLSDDTRGLLQSAAVVGRDFSVELLVSVCGMDPDRAVDAIEQAERRRIVRSKVVGRAVNYAFEHELVRQTLLAELSAPRRQRLHLRIASALETQSGDDRVSEIAHHLYEAGSGVDQEKLLRFLLMAAERAMSSTATEEAMRHTERGLGLDGVPDAYRAALLYLRGGALWGMGNWEKCTEDWQTSLTLYEKLGDAKGVSRVTSGLMVPIAWAGRWEDLVKLTDRAEATIGTDPTEERCLLLCHRSAGTAIGGAIYADETERHLAEAEEIAKTLRARHLEGIVAAYRAHPGIFSEELEVAARNAERAVELLRPSARVWDLPVALAWMVTVALKRGELDEVARIGEECVRVSRKVGHLGGLSFGERHLAQRAFMISGDLEAYADFAECDIETVRQVAPRAIAGSITAKGLVQFWNGDWEGAVVTFTGSLDVPTVPIFVGAIEGAHLFASAYLGKSDALALMSKYRSHLPRLGAPNESGRYRFLLHAIEALAVLDKPADAAELYPLTRELLHRGGKLLMTADYIEKAAAIAAAAGEQWDVAETHFENALEQVDTMPYRLQQPEVRRWYAWMFLSRNRTGDREKANALLEQAIAAYREIGMPRHEQLARKMMV